MQTDVKVTIYGRTESYASVGEYVATSLDGSDYDRGSLETVEATAENLREAFGRLVECLYVGKALTDSQVIRIAQDYEGYFDQ